MWGSIAAAGISALGSVAGGLISNKGSSDANDAMERAAALQTAYQREFAQNGIRWKVADAKAAGIHPLAALGAPTLSYNPVMTQYSGGGDFGVSDALHQMGQGVSRAMQAKQAAEERGVQRRLAEAQIENVNAQADAARAQAEASRAAVAKTALPPAMPTVNGMTSQSSSPFWEAPIVSDAFRLDHKGRKVDIIPSEAVKNRVEDVFGVEWLPFIHSAIDNFKGKVLGRKVKGYYWDDERGEYTRRKPKKRESQFDRNIQNVLSGY